MVFDRKTALNTCKQLCENGGKSLTLRCHISKLRIMKTCKFVSVQSKYICAVKLLCLFKGVIIICSPPFPGIWYLIMSVVFAPNVSLVFLQNGN